MSNQTRAESDELGGTHGRIAPLSVLLLMGVSGSGKSRIGALLAARLGWAFKDADDIHPMVNLEKMRTGIPLDEADRLPWLRDVASWIDVVRWKGQRAVVACSALKRAYRTVLLGGRPDVHLVYLKADEALVSQRLANRTGHFMPSSLLRTQFEALEEPGPEENPIVVSVVPGPESIMQEIVQQLEARTGREGLG